MEKKNPDNLLIELKEKFHDVQHKLDLGVPRRKIQSEINHIKQTIFKDWLQIQRDQKITYNKITEKLNDEGVPTLTGKGKWDARTVYRMLKDN